MKMKKNVYENGKLHFNLRFNGKEHEREVVTLVRAGDTWMPDYKGKPVCKVVSDGNGLDVTIYRSIGEKPTLLRLDFAEASDLGILLTEYTKTDPNHAEITIINSNKPSSNLDSGAAIALRNEQARAMMNCAPVFVESKPDAYCWTCGAGCITTTGYGLFDTKTGEQYTWPIYKCPNDAWYKFWHPVIKDTTLSDLY